MFINLLLLIHNTINISLIQLNWFYFEVFLSNECNFFYFYSLCNFVIWTSLMVSNNTSFLCSCTPFKLLCLQSSLNVAETVNESKSLAISTACIFPFFFAQSKAFRIANLPFSCLHFWPYFSHWSYVHITYFIPFHRSIFSNSIAHYPHSNYPKKTMVSEKTKMRVVRIELTTLGLWDPRSSNWAKLAATCFQNNPILLPSLHYHLMFLWTRKSRFGTITSSII